MSYTDVGKASVTYYDAGWNPDGRKWTCTCDDCEKESLLGSWSCPSFYDGTITISNDFTNGFTSVKNNDHINVCINQGT